MTTEFERDLAALAGRLRASSVAVRSAHGAGSGSGIIWSSDGTIVTNAHVAVTSHVEIDLADGRRIPGIVDRRDERADLARIRVDAAGLTAAAYRDPRDLRVGEFAAAFGNPLGVRNVLSTGIVFAAHRPGRDRFIRADVRIAPGNSGGALADFQGRVIGINSMVAGDLALAIPADEVLGFLGEALPPARLGVRLAPADIGAGRRGYAVVAVEPGSLAERSGIILGDVIVKRDLAGLAAVRQLDVIRGGDPLVVALRRQSENAAAA